MARRLFKLGLVGRPTNPEYYGLRTGSGQNSIVLTRTSAGEQNLNDIYSIAYKCNAIRKSIQSLRDYIFKEGYEWFPRFSKKCRLCGHEHPPGKIPEQCERCNSINLYEPDPAEHVEANRFFERVDVNGHTLIEVLKMYEDHLNIADDSFMIVAKDYELDKNGDILGWQVRELFVPDPRNFQKVINPHTQRPGGLYYICIQHRPINDMDDMKRFIDVKSHGGKVYKEPGRCEICEKKLYDVWYVSTNVPTGGTTYSQNGDANVTEYFIGDVVLKDRSVCQEVIHNSKYSGSYGYGESPISSVWNMAWTLVRMEEYVRKFYEEERTPRGAIFIPSNNPEGVRAAWDEAEHRNVSQGGTYTPKFTFDPGMSGGSRPVQYIEFSKLPQELQMMETSDYFYRRIGSAFGVAPVFHGNVDAVGLQQQGPTQWQVTVLAAQQGQDVYNSKLLKSLARQLGIDNWILRLRSAEEKDDAQKIQLDIMKANHAQMMMALGYKPLMRDENGSFVYPAKPSEITDPNMQQTGGDQTMGGATPPLQADNMGDMKQMGTPDMSDGGPTSIGLGGV